MQTVSEIIQELRKTSSTLGKQAILERNRDNELLRMVFNMTENPMYNYYIRVDPQVYTQTADGQLTMALLDSVVDVLHNRNVTGNRAKEWLQRLINSLNPQDADILTKIINRDLDCKTGTALINKTWKGMIPEMPCMLASKLDAKAINSIKPKKDGYIIQRKEDGGRCMAVVNQTGGVEFLSRNGKPLLTHGVFDAQLSQFPGFVFDGELLVVSDSGVADRKTGNGFFNKAVRNTIKPEEAIKFQYVVWDMIPYADFFNGYSAVPYNERLAFLYSVSNRFTPGRIVPTESKVISSLEEAQVFYERMIAEGQEGAIIKFADSPWENKRSKFMIKMKEELDIDAEVIDVIPHTKKPDWIGALKCQTRDGKVVFEVGSGFTDEDRQKPASFYFGKIVQCKYNALITAKGRDTHSLFLPVFQNVRFDKTEANSFEELK